MPKLPRSRRSKAPSVSKVALKRSIYRDSFFEFIKTFWHVIIPEEPVWNWHIPILAEEIQVAAERVFANKPKEYDLVINIPPGTTKSTLCSVMYPAWAWTRMPSHRAICGSYSLIPLATDLSRRCRDIVKSPLYQELFPEVKIRADQDTKVQFTNTEGGMRYAVGTMGSVTGLHGHSIVIDDPLDPMGAASDADIKSSNEWISETLSQRMVNKSVSLVILVMQRLHQGDPTGFRLKQKEAGSVRHIKLPATLNDEVMPPEFKRFYQDGLLDPIRLSKQTLASQYGVLGEYGYASQMMQNPVPRGGAMFKIDKFHMESSCNKKLKEVVRFWDKAGTRGAGAFTVGVKMGIDSDNEFWILDVVRGQWEASKRELIIHQTAIMDGYNVRVGLEQEPGSAGLESAQNTIKRLVGYRVQADRPTGDKERRADTFATQVNIGNVHVLDRHWTQEYIEELRYFPVSTYKDQVDSSSGSFAMLERPKVRIGAL